MLCRFAYDVLPRCGAPLAAFALVLAATGCWQGSNKPAFESGIEFAEVVRPSETNRPDALTEIEAGASTVFVANGFANEPDATDRRVGYSFLRICNPSTSPNTLHIRLYFDTKPPIDIDPIELDAQSNKYLYSLPRDWAEQLAGAKAWGARFSSELPVIVDHWLLAGILPPGAGHQIDDARFKGGGSDTLATPDADRIWHFGDGLRLEFERSTRDTPFNEFEWYHVLNPGLEDASVAMYWYYDDGEHVTHTFDVPAERVRIASNLELARPNRAYGIKFVSSVPIVVQCMRFASDTHGMTEWGAWLHAARPGVTDAELRSWSRTSE